MAYWKSPACWQNEGPVEILTLKQAHFSLASVGNLQGPFVAKQMENFYFGNPLCLFLNSFQSFLNLRHSF